MVAGSTSKASNQGQKKNSEKSSSKARDEIIPSAGTSTNETTSDVSSYRAVQTSGAAWDEWVFTGEFAIL